MLTNKYIKQYPTRKRGTSTTLDDKKNWKNMKENNGHSKREGLPYQQTKAKNP